MRFLFTFILAAVFLLGSFFIFDVLPKTVRMDSTSKEIVVGTNKFKVEIANTLALQAQGLSNHSLLLEDEGMLFVFDQPQVPGFWMKDMNFSIDIVWISAGKVVGVSENLLPDDGVDRKIYYPPELIDSVLEVSAGTVFKNNIKIGDVVIE